MRLKIAEFLHLLYGLRAGARSIRGYLSVDELIRVALPALLHGGGVVAALAAIGDDAGHIFVNPTAAGIATAVLTAVVQVIRLLGQGYAPVANRHFETIILPSRRAH